MKKVFVTVVVILGLTFINGCTPEALNTNDTIELVDKDKNVRPGNQGNNTSETASTTDGD